MRRLEEGVRSPGVDTAVSCPAWVLEADLGSSAKTVIHVLKDRAISAAPQADTEGKLCRGRACAQTGWYKGCCSLRKRSGRVPEFPSVSRECPGTDGLNQDSSELLCKAGL